MGFKRRSSPARDPRARGLLDHLDADRRRALFDDLNYLNLGEFRRFCDRHGVPYRILARRADGSTWTTTDADRKPVVLDRVRRYLTSGQVPEPTCLAAAVVRREPAPASFAAGDRIYYRWYNKKHRQLMGLLAELTGGEFRDGVVARLLILDFWTASRSPTVAEFAAAWVAARRQDRDLVVPAYAYLTDLRNERAGADWKALRVRRAARALEVLDALPAPA